MPEHVQRSQQNWLQRRSLWLEISSRSLDTVCLEHIQPVDEHIWHNHLRKQHAQTDERSNWWYFSYYTDCWHLLPWHHWHSWLSPWSVRLDVPWKKEHLCVRSTFDGLRTHHGRHQSHQQLAHGLIRLYPTLQLDLPTFTRKCCSHLHC